MVHFCNNHEHERTHTHIFWWVYTLPCISRRIEPSHSLNLSKNTHLTQLISLETRQEMRPHTHTHLHYHILSLQSSTQEEVQSWHWHTHTQTSWLTDKDLYQKIKVFLKGYSLAVCASSSVSDSIRLLFGLKSGSEGILMPFHTFKLRKYYWCDIFKHREGQGL